MEPLFIKVLGEIKAEDDTPQYALGWTCGSIGREVTDPSFRYNKDEHIVESDLILNSKVRSVPYAIYFTEKGICGRHIVACAGIGGAYAYFKENISSVRNQLALPIEDSIAETVYNGLYIEVFSALELFLADALLCLIFTNEGCHCRAISFYKDETGRTKDIKRDELIKSVYNYFSKTIVYHCFPQVKKAYTVITGLSFPDTNELQRQLFLRHNIVHRHSLDGLSRMRVTCATKESVEYLLQTVSEFADSLVKINIGLNDCKS
jgi:hypothetical protein